ncbi:hypothetical protein DFH11DRAFT_1548228 [Phellopilus nigrolimitatus]|nr:hypothetical protein DFH11DRAFT_1548228 [Phellopilus nigrolimitatus]
MSSFFKKIKEKATKRRSASGSKKDKKAGEEQQFSIQPHPAKTNDPADLNGTQAGGGLATAQNPASAVHNTPGPVIPNADANIGEPAVRSSRDCIRVFVPILTSMFYRSYATKSRDELRVRAAELNSK